MTLSELEIRVATLEQKLAHLAIDPNAPVSTNINDWIDKIHGTFQDDATYRKAVRLGRQWRKSHPVLAAPRSRKIAGK